jgi:hypothetical protein
MTSNGAAAGPSPEAALEPGLRARLTAVMEDGWEIWERFDREVRAIDFHPFVPADYEIVLAALVPLRDPGLRFLEWGSGTGVIAILADLLGFEAYGIELDPRLVEMARGLAERHGSAARFEAGSFFPAGYRYRAPNGETRTGTLEPGESAYPRLGHPLDDFDVVYGYPWDGEAPIMLDLMRHYGARDARLMLMSGIDGPRLFRDGRPIG